MDHVAPTTGFELESRSPMVLSHFYSSRFRTRIQNCMHFLQLRTLAFEAAQQSTALADAGIGFRMQIGRAHV